jgi:Putative Ig domain
MRVLSRLVLSVLISTALAACSGPATVQSVDPPLSPGTNPAPVSTPANNTSVPTNAAPTISGAPQTTISVGAAYSFVPSAQDSDGNALTFSILGSPSWASFNPSTGALTGTPTAQQAGSYGNIVISVSDGIATQSLPAFSVNVTQLLASTGSATLSWTPPTQNTDGSPLTNLAGYRVYHGSNASALNTVVDVNNPGITISVVDNLASGQHYFAVSAYSSSGAESDRSTIGSKLIP